jgi:hypothetical protein
MATPNAPEERSVVDDLAQIHAALRVNSHFFESQGLGDLPADERRSVREHLEFIIGRAIVQNCDDKQLEQLEQEVQGNGTLAALRWLYSETPHTFRDAIRAGLLGLVEDLRGRYPESIRPTTGPTSVIQQRSSNTARSGQERGMS